MCIRDRVPTALPSLVKANRIQEKASGVGFDWEYREQVWEKVKEEVNELSHEIDKVDKEKTEAEFGDLFFAMVNAARLYGVDPEAALERTNLKFIKRFNYLEDRTLLKGKNLHDMTLAEIDVYKRQHHKQVVVNIINITHFAMIYVSLSRKLKICFY